MTSPVRTAAQAPKPTPIVTPDDLRYAHYLLDTLPPELWEIGCDWYASVRERCKLWSLETGYSLEQCAAVLAVMSRRQRWTVNVRNARKALYSGSVYGLEDVVLHVRAILSGAPVSMHLTNGRKTRDFYRCIMGEHACACDIWMHRIFDRPPRPPHYDFVVECVRLLAVEYDVPIEQMQAVLWLAVVADSGQSISDHMPMVG